MKPSLFYVRRHTSDRALIQVCAQTNDELTVYDISSKRALELASELLKFGLGVFNEDSSNR